MTATVTGLPAERGSWLLARASSEIWWLARSMFLCAGCDRVLPRFRFRSSDTPASDASAPGTSSPEPRAAVVGARAVFGFRRDPEMESFAGRHGMTVAMPPAALTTRVADKLHLAGIAVRAGVAVPRSVCRRGVSAADAAALWSELGACAAVVQLADNDLTGAGTRYVADPGELADCLAGWRGRDVKLAEYVTGIPLTVSGTVTGGEVAVSGISYQVVGHPRLTPLWGAHCGNQLVDDAALPATVAGRSREIAARLGTVLAGWGFRGIFGADLVATGDDVLVLEINPRVQSVSSLLNAVEIGAGLLPAPGLHVLAHLSEEAAPLTTVAVPPPTYGQVVLSAHAQHPAAVVPDEGLWVLGEGGCHRAGPVVRLSQLGPDEALVWPLARPGASVLATDRLYVLQLPRPVVRVEDGRLTGLAGRWLDALEACCPGAEIPT